MPRIRHYSTLQVRSFFLLYMKQMTTCPVLIFSHWEDFPSPLSLSGNPQSTTGVSVWQHFQLAPIYWANPSGNQAWVFLSLQWSTGSMSPWGDTIWVERCISTTQVGVPGVWDTLSVSYVCLRDLLVPDRECTISILWWIAAAAIQCYALMDLVISVHKGQFPTCNILGIMWSGS